MYIGTVAYVCLFEKDVWGSIMNYYYYNNVYVSEIKKYITYNY